MIKDIIIPIKNRMADEYPLGSFQGLWDAAAAVFGEEAMWLQDQLQTMVAGSYAPNTRSSGKRAGPVGSLYCPTCSDMRRMFLTEIYVASSASSRRISVTRTRGRLITKPHAGSRNGARAGDFLAHL